MSLAVILRVVALVALALWLTDLLRDRQPTTAWRVQVALASLGLAVTLVLLATTPAAQ